MTPREMALTIAKALDSKKGLDIKVLETGPLTTLADYFVICTATSTTQVKALADECEKVMKEAGELPHHVEGHRGGTWVLLDFSSVVVHLFMEEAREFYDVEPLRNAAGAVARGGPPPRKGPEGKEKKIGGATEPCSEARFAVKCNTWGR